MTNVDHTGHGGHAHVFTRGERVSLCFVWTLVVASLLPWRSGNYYSGGVDPVVMAKALLTVIAFVIVFGRFLRVRPAIQLGAWTPLLVTTYVAVTWLGGFAGGTTVSSTVLALRLFLTAAAIMFAVLAYSGVEALRTLVVTLGTIGLVLGLSGFQGLATKGRLYSSLLPVNPNQVALLLGPPIIWLVWRMVQMPARLRDLAVLVSLLGLTWLTGSRTGLLAVAVGVVIVLLQAPGIPRGGFISLLALMPGAFYVLAFTGLITGYVYREGGNITTLNSRTIAWSTVFNVPMDFWEHWFGGGLAVKTIGVSGQYWSEQVFDSSWISAYAQAGVVGVSILAIWVVGAVVSAVRAPRPFRSVLTALIVCAVIRSGLENGLLDSYVLFVTMLAPTLVAELKDRGNGRFSPENTDLVAENQRSDSSRDASTGGQVVPQWSLIR